MNHELVIAHTFSCKLRVVKKHSVNKLKVFTYSLVCQYVKDLCENPDTRRFRFSVVLRIGFAYPVSLSGE